MQNWLIIRLAATTVMLLPVFSWAASLDTPVEKKVTIGSEIKRGQLAAFDCFDTPNR